MHIRSIKYITAGSFVYAFLWTEVPNPLFPAAYIKIRYAWYTGVLRLPVMKVLQGFTAMIRKLMQLQLVQAPQCATSLRNCMDLFPVVLEITSSMVLVLLVSMRVFSMGWICFSWMSKLP